jgi:methionyl-tRNA formyltransferase
MSDCPGWWQKPRIISIVVDSSGWFVPFAHSLVKRLENNGDDARFIMDYSSVPIGSVAFYLSCTRITPRAILARNKCNLLVHASDLPRGRGFSPAAWQLLEGTNKVPVVMIHAREPVDSGEIVMRDELQFEGHELNSEWRRALGKKIVEMCCAVLTRPLPPNGEPQAGEPSWYRRRSPKDSRLDPAKTLAEQFNLLRVVDNECYPAFFEYRGHTYVLRIDKLEAQKATATNTDG